MNNTTSSHKKYYDMSLLKNKDIIYTKFDGKIPSVKKTTIQSNLNPNKIPSVKNTTTQSNEIKIPKLKIVENSEKNIHNKSIKKIDLENEPGATGIKSDYKDNTDPAYIGPGIWDFIHRTAFNAKTVEEQKSFIKQMKTICDEFPCIKCRGHCQEYIKNHPMEEYIDVTVDMDNEKINIGIFVWTWKFHNAVNARLNKPIMTWDTAYNIYSHSESLVCSTNCINSS